MFLYSLGFQGCIVILSGWIQDGFIFVTPRALHIPTGREGGGQGVQLICPRLYIYTGMYVYIYVHVSILDRHSPEPIAALASRGPGFQGIINKEPGHR